MNRIASSDSKVVFNNLAVESDSLNILINEYMYNGGGVALADFNNDGLDDIYFTGNVVDNALYLNQGNLEFKDVTQKSNTSCSGSWSMGVSVIDINNDGWLDMHIAVSGNEAKEKRKNILLINQGLDSEGIPVFVNKADSYGLAYEGFSINSYFFDYNKDGLMDMFLINNHFTNRGDVLSKRNFQKDMNVKNLNRLYKNIDGKHFEDVTLALYRLLFLMLIKTDGWIFLFPMILQPVVWRLSTNTMELLRRIFPLILSTKVSVLWVLM